MTDTLAEDLDTGDAPGWRPEEGSTIIGEVIRLSKGWSEQAQKFYPIITIKDESTGEPVAVHGFHFVLQDRLSAIRPRVGERIGIKMGEKIKTQDGRRTVQTYTVKVDGRSEDIWSDIKSPRVAQAQAQSQTALPVSQVADDDIPF
jgi:hypothetical protein